MIPMKIDKMSITKLITGLIALLTSLGSGIGIGTTIPQEHDKSKCTKE